MYKDYYILPKIYYYYYYYFKNENKNIIALKFYFIK